PASGNGRDKPAAAPPLRQSKRRLDIIVPSRCIGPQSRLSKNITCEGGGGIRRANALASVRQHAAHAARGQKLVRDAAEDPFAQSTTAVAAGDDQIAALVADEIEQLGGDRAAGLPP